MFKKGQSGNLAGKPKGTKNHNGLSELIKQKTKNGLTLVNELNNIFQNSKDETVKISAAKLLIENGWGKPIQRIEGEVDQNLIIEITKYSDQ